MRPLPIALISLLLASLSTSAAVNISAPPDSFFDLVPQKHQAKARGFYKKHLSVNGLPVAASEVVADEALSRTHEIVERMLAGRPDVLSAMISNRMYLIIIGKDQVYTDMPEYSDHPNPEFQNERVRGTGGKPTSFGEENLLSLPLDRYDDESIAVHEFCHTIDGTLRALDNTWTQRRNETYRKALEAGLWKNSYAASNPGEYWAEVAQSYFNCNRVNNWNHGPVGTREQLKSYDPLAYELVRSTFRLEPAQDWRYSWVQPLPNIITPPARFKIDPYYTKFTYAREIPVVGRGASDESMLKANDLVRKMFAYRHDILKAFINAGAKLVVLGKNEALSELPEVQAHRKENAKVDTLARFLEYSPDHKLIVVAEENLLGNPKNPNVGDNQGVRLFAKAIFDFCAQRPVDPNWENRGREVQQYELRVTRIDFRFKEQLEALFHKASEQKKWRGTGALQNPSEYFARGVVAYFDAAGQLHAPEDAAFPISTREQLREYDAELHDLVARTMAYESHVDWRLGQ